ncbi:hypothetical protein H5V44_10940 [Halobellus sp. MBLA0160]|uniref:Uncharacterized protein n=1 Tax=Halobellus ruber TaxID=2761102 RepID=A0A7J9SIL4_9EURY|nr:hypothetical protein [Halobellus ruber]
MRLPPSVVHGYRRFSLYNSPYPAHDRGCAIDLYPADSRGRSPVAGEVVATRTVRAPPKPYAADEEFLILVDIDADRTGLRVDRPIDEGIVARILHVRPEVSPGDVVDVGDDLGPMVRSGFFAPWVGNHVHVGFRRSEQNLLRAGGSLPVEAAVDVEPLTWDGVGTVTRTGDTYAVLDSPTHPAPGERFAGIAGLVGGEAGAGTAGEETLTVLDGGLAHYTGGGLPGRTVAAGAPESTTVTLLGHHLGDATGRDVAWRDVDVLANGDRITGLSLFAARDPAFGAKLVCPDREFDVGDAVRVTVRDSDEPIRLG